MSETISRYGCSSTATIGLSSPSLSSNHHTLLFLLILHRSVLPFLSLSLLFPFPPFPSSFYPFLSNLPLSLTLSSSSLPHSLFFLSPSLSLLPLSLSPSLPLSPSPHYLTPFLCCINKSSCAYQWSLIRCGWGMHECHGYNVNHVYGLGRQCHGT